MLTPSTWFQNRIYNLLAPWPWKSLFYICLLPLIIYKCWQNKIEMVSNIGFLYRMNGLKQAKVLVAVPDV